MLKIFNDLKPFLQDNYRRINVREYAKLAGVTPPTASKLLSCFSKEGLLRQEHEKNYVYYSANKDNELFIDLSRAYWHIELKNSGFLEHLEKELLNPLVILFGSFSKAEVRSSSDIDIAVFSASDGKSLDLGPFEKKLKRSIHIFHFSGRKGVENAELLNNIRNGLILAGGWRDNDGLD